MNPYVLMLCGAIIYAIGYYKGTRTKKKFFDGDAGRYTINGIVLFVLGLAWLFK